MRPFDRRLLTYARASAAFLLTCAASGVVVAGLVLTQATLLAHTIASAFDGAGLADLDGSLVALGCVCAARALVGWLQEVAAQRAAAAVKSELRTRLVEHSLHLGPRWLAGQRSGELVTLVGTGLDALDAYFARYLPQLFLAVAVPIMVIGRLAAADLVSAVTVAVTLPLVPVFMVLIGLATQSQARRRWRALAVLAHHFTDVVGGLATLKAFGRAKAQAGEVRRVTDAHRVATMSTLRLAFLSSLVLELLSSLAVALVAVGIGLRLVNGGLGLETALLVLLLAPEAYLPLRQLGAQHHASADGLAAAAEALDILELPLPTSRQSPARQLAADNFETIELHSVQVESDDRTEPLLPTTSLVLRRGEIIAVTGVSGAGKSTLLDVLMRFVEPTSGSVTIDGVGLRHMDPAAWRTCIGWVPQRPHLPEDTVFANLALGVRHLTADAARRALASVGAAHLDLALPTGDDGSLISAGECRRVAIARALVTDASLLLLDEPTAGLDATSESAVLESLRTAGRTVLVVAHRPAVLAAADRVVKIGSNSPAELVPA